MKLLFLSPHPDDVEFGCGGTIALSSKRHECHIAVMCGDGDLTMRHSGQMVSFEERKAEQDLAAEKLGVRKVHYMNVGPASELDTVPLSVGVSKLEELLYEGWDQLFIPMPSFNQDHVWTHDVAIAATRPGNTGWTWVLKYEQHLNCHGPQSTTDAKLYVRFARAEMMAKKEAIQCHRSQMVGRFERNWEATEALAKLRGFECNYTYAERFLPVRVVI